MIQNKSNRQQHKYRGYLKLIPPHYSEFSVKRKTDVIFLINTTSAKFQHITHPFLQSRIHINSQYFEDNYVSFQQGFLSSQ